MTDQEQTEIKNKIAALESLPQRTIEQDKELFTLRGVLAQQGEPPADPSEVEDSGPDDTGMHDDDK